MDRGPENNFQPLNPHNQSSYKSTQLLTNRLNEMAAPIHPLLAHHSKCFPTFLTSFNGSFFPENFNK